MKKPKVINAAGADGQPIQIEVVKDPRPKRKKHKPRESSIVQSILEYLNGLPGVKAKKRHQSQYQRNEPDIDCCAFVLVPFYLTSIKTKLGSLVDDSPFPRIKVAIAYKFEVKKPGEKSTPAQIEAMKHWISVGVRVHIVYSKEDVREIMIADGFDLKR